MSGRAWMRRPAVHEVSYQGLWSGLPATKHAGSVQARPTDPARPPLTFPIPDTIPYPVSLIRSELAGQARLVLVLQLPPKVVDETSDAIREEVSARLPNCEGAGVVLDCREVELINSIGITCLLQVQDYCRRHRARLVLAAIPPAIAGFLARLKLDRRFERHETVEDAVAQIDRGTA